MDKVELKRAIGRSAKQGINQSAAASTNLHAAVIRESIQNNLVQSRLIGAANNWDQAVEVFRDGRKNYLEGKTLTGYLTLIKAFTDWLEEVGLDKEIPPALVNESVITEFLDHCLNKGNTKGTANSKLTALKIFFNFLAEKGVVKENPTLGIKKFHADESPIFSFTPEQLRRIFAVIPLNTWAGARDNSIFRMILETGCRVEEAVNLLIPDIQFSHDVPVRLTFAKTKNHHPREVAITPKLAEAIILWMDKRRDFHVSPDEVPILHISTELTPVTMRVLQRRFLQYCQLAGVDKEGVRCSPYTLKHTFCKLYLLGGGSVNALREIVGHIDQRSIMKYVRATAKEASENHQRFAPSNVYNF